MIIQRPGQKILTIGNPGLQIISPRGGAAWTPANISGCFLWLDFSDPNTLFTDAGITKVSNNGDAIYQANDKSGNSNHAIQSTEANRPLYMTNIQNSLSASLFDGSNDYLHIPYDASVQNAVNNIFLVCNETSGNRFAHHLHITATNFRWHFGWYNYDAKIQSWINGVSTIGSLLADRSTLRIYFYDTKDNDVYANGTNVLSGTGADITYAANWGIRIGANASGGEAMGGNILEIICYNNQIGPDNKTLVSDYLNAKWNIY